MTGYGSAQKRNGNFHIEIEVRSVNHRFINLKQSLPDGLVRHENEIDKLLRQKVHRGSVTVLVTLKPIHHRTQNLPDGKTIKTFVQHLRKIQKEAGIEGEIKMNALLTFPHLWNNSGHEEKEAASWPATRQLIMEAFENLAKMRGKEGSGIKKDLEGRLKRIEKLASLIGKRTGGVLTRYENRLESRIQNLLKNKGFDIAKPDILREVAVHADKCDISEELQRLQSHIKQFRSIMKTGGQMGRKLDFLNQEMVRETTTMTAKGNDAKISSSAVNIKAELEKIKEQVENIE